MSKQIMDPMKKINPILVGVAIPIVEEGSFFHIGLENLCNEELLRASSKYGEKYNTALEGCAVLRAEEEEASTELDMVQESVATLWLLSTRCRHDQYDDPQRVLKYCREHALKGAAELIQVAAVCDKNLRGYISDEKAKE